MSIWRICNSIMPEMILPMIFSECVITALLGFYWYIWNLSFLILFHTAPTNKPKAFLDLYQRNPLFCNSFFTNFMIIENETLTFPYEFLMDFIPPTLPIILAQSHYICEKIGRHQGSFMTPGAWCWSGHFSSHCSCLVLSFPQEHPLNTSWHWIKVGYTVPSPFSQS